MDLFAKCPNYTAARAAMAAGVYPYFLGFDGQEGTTVRHEGRDLIMCGSNNYLGLATDERLLEAARTALGRYGSSCTGSRFLNGNLSLHEQLEEELADYFGKPAALVFTTGYQANLGTIAALLSKSDSVIIDKDAHASIIDGCRLSRATIKRFNHNDAADLEAVLASCPPSGGTLVVVDGVYSMEGDLCPLPAITQACRRHGARLLVDDAHGAGVLAGGKGTCAHFGLTDEVDLISLTFSKSFGSLGGAVLGDEDVIHYLRHHARSLMFSASMAPASAAAALTALQIMREEPWRAARARENADRVRDGLVELGFDVGFSETPIIPVHAGGFLDALLLWRRLLDAGVYTNPIVPPAASPRLRTSFMATHTAEDLERVLQAFATAAHAPAIDADALAIST